MEEARAAAVMVAEAIGDEIGLPVFLYRESGEGRAPAFFRRGGLVELQRRIDGGEVRPDFGPARLDPAAGCVLVGARSPLVAFNVNLASTDLEVARAIAALVREDGTGFRGVRALGLPLPSRGLVQVSMNVEDWQASPLQEIVSRIEAEAAERGVQVAGSELVGLMPAGAAAAAAASALGLERLDESRLLEPRLLS
jgi:glutamate formiminotransferase/glutamate formiminotransferase/formiminotetrahydrofolate cyclodeaminase